MKYYLLTLLTLFVFCTSHSQNEKFSDSISQIIKEQKSDSSRASLYYDAAAYSAQRLSNIKLMRLYTDSSMHYAVASGHKDLEAKNHFAYGMLERLEGNYKKALNHLQKNIDYFENDSLMKPYALFQVGVIQKNMGNYQKSLKTYFEILSIFEKRKDSFASASTLNSIAVIYGELNNYEEAISNFLEARKIFVAKDVKRDIANTDSNISNMYAKKQDYKNAIKYAESCLKIAEQIDHKNLIGRALQALGNIYKVSDKRKGLDYLLKAGQVFVESGFYKEIISVNRDIGNAYFELGNFDSAKEYLIKGLDLSRENNILLEVELISKSLADVYSKESNFKAAYNYRLEYENAKDSLFSLKNEKSIKELQTKFETEKKDRELAEQKLAIEQQELQLQKQQSKSKLMTGLAIALLLTSILIWFLYQQRQKRKDQEIIAIKREQQVKTLELLMEGEEKERFRIAKELHDGVNVDLSAIKYKLTSLLEKNNEVINEAVSMIDKSCEQVRAISHNLVPPALKDFSLIEALEDYCSTTNAIHDAKVSFQTIGSNINLPQKAEVNIFRIIQELVSNSVKHAEASEIDVQISCQKNAIQLTVEDNGKGFDLDVNKANGIGLQNVKSRVDYLNAKLDVTSDDKGTSFVIDINTNELS